jgi:hypothetical protein
MGEFLKLLGGSTSSINDVKLNPLGPPEQGTLRNFLGRIGMNPTVEEDSPIAEQAIPKSDPPVAQRGVLREENIPLPQPRPNFGMQSMGQPIITQARQAIMKGAGMTGQDIMSFEQRMQPAQRAIADGVFDPQGANYTDMKKNGQKPIQIPKGTKFADSDFSSKGKVIPLHPPGTFSANTDIGDFINASAQSMGIKPPNNVIPFPKKGK